MTGTAYPGDAVTGVPTYTATQGRSAFAAAMGGATTARPLGGFTGVRPGTASTILTIPTNTTWQLTPFGGYIDLESPGTTGGYFFSFQANETGTIAAAAGSIRSDLLYVQINDSNTGDGSGLSPRVVTGVQTGVPGAGIPTLTVARAFVLAVITVPASGGGSPTFTWVTTYTAAAGGILPVPAGVYPASPYLGQYVDDATLGLLRYNGTAWAPLTIACTLRKSANQTLTSSAAALAWDVEISDPSNMHDNVTNNTRITAPIAGLYEVSAMVFNNNTSGIGTVQGRLNGTTDIVGSLNRRTADAASLTLNPVFQLEMSAGDYVEIMVLHSVAGGTIAGGTTVGAAIVTMKRIGA